MDKKKIQGYKQRIKRAMNSFSVGGDFLLQMEIDAMSQEERVMLQSGLKEGRIPVSYKYLDEKIAANQ